MEGDCGEVGLACPPLDLAFSGFADLNFDLSPDSFFRGIDDGGNEHHHDHKATKIYGIGKEWRLLEKLYKPSSIANNKVDDEEHAAALGPKFECAKRRRVDDDEEDAAAFRPKFECAKRKLHESYEQLEREKKRRQVQLISLSDLPKCRQPVKQCRGVKRARTRFAPALKQPKFAACH